MKKYCIFVILFISYLLLTTFTLPCHAEVTKVYGVNNIAIEGFTVSGDDLIVDDGTLIVDEDQNSVKPSEINFYNSRLPVGIVSFTFDDVDDSVYDDVWLTGGEVSMADQNEVGTLYINTNSIGGAGNLTWAELLTIQADRWEIAAHTPDHDYRTPYFTNQGTLQAKITEEIADAAAQGITLNNFAYPWYETNAATRKILRQNYRSATGASRDSSTGDLDSCISGSTDFCINRPPFDTYQLFRVNCDTLSADEVDAKAVIKKAYEDRGWVIFMCHAANLDANDRTSLNNIIEYVQENADVGKCSNGDYTTNATCVAGSGTWTRIQMMTVNDALDAIGNTIDSGDSWNGGVATSDVGGVRTSSISVDGSSYYSEISFNGSEAAEQDLLVRTPFLGVSVTNYCLKVLAGDVSFGWDDTGACDSSDGAGDISINPVYLNNGVSVSFLYPAGLGGDHDEGDEYKFTAYPQQKNYIDIHKGNRTPEGKLYVRDIYRIDRTGKFYIGGEQKGHDLISKYFYVLNAADMGNISLALGLFNEATDGGVITDYSGNSLTASYTASSNFTADDRKLNYATYYVNLDGTDDYLTVNDSTVLSPETSAFSVAFWWNNISTDSKVLIAKHDNGSNKEFKIYEDAAERIRWRIVDNTDGDESGVRSTGQAEGWHFVVVTLIAQGSCAGVYDDGEMKIYIDGAASFNDLEANSVTCAETIDDTTATLTVGALGDGSLFHDSGITPPIIYKGTALNAGQVIALWEAVRGEMGK